MHSARFVLRDIGKQRGGNVFQLYIGNRDDDVFSYR
jgi:hypothetical protein